MRLLLLFLLLLPVGVLKASDLPYPEFEADSTTGERYALPSGQAGVGVYVFWASWCPYCRSLMPHLQSIVAEYGDEVNVYALQFRDDESAADYVERFGYDFVVFDDADQVAEAWGIHATPAVIILDGEGRLRFDLYELLGQGPTLDADLPHGLKASRLAPFWAVEIRKAIDRSRDKLSIPPGNDRGQ